MLDDAAMIRVIIIVLKRPILLCMINNMFNNTWFILDLPMHVYFALFYCLVVNQNSANELNIRQFTEKRTPVCSC